MTEMLDLPNPSAAGPYVDDQPFLGTAANPGPIRPQDLVYFVLNVGNADTQLLVLPEYEGVRHMVIVDIGAVHGGKLWRLINDLRNPPDGTTGLLTDASRVKLLVATHPHADHVGGIPNFLTNAGELLAGGEIWDPAFYHSTGSWHSMMAWLQDHPEVARTHPTAGTRRHIGNVAVTALSPSIRLRNNFDTYGVHINNSSISLMVEFPIARVFTGDDDTFATGPQDRRVQRQKLLLGGDAQTMSWSHVDVDFPTLKGDWSPEQRLLGLAFGGEPLSAHVFKVPHHCSKYGLNLEMVERIDPSFSLISCHHGTTGHAFPHALALNQLREAKHATASSGDEYRRDWDPRMNIITTDERFENGDRLGSIAMVLTPTGRNRRLFRLQDVHNQRIDPARLVTTLQKLP